MLDCHAGTRRKGAASGQKVQVYGVAFYNLENLFDTINNNGKYDKEFSPQGKNQWDSRRYWKKSITSATPYRKCPPRARRWVRPSSV